MADVLALFILQISRSNQQQSLGHTLQTAIVVRLNHLFNVNPFSISETSLFCSLVTPTPRLPFFFSTVDSENKYGQTPLSWAAPRGHEALVKLLLETGQVEVDTKDKFWG
jgi:ankyrin repeat protein